MKTRFVEVNPQEGELMIEERAGSDAATAELMDGQHMDVSFRRGHKKCVFRTVTLGRRPLANRDIDGISAIRLRYPEEMAELQRRLYHRAFVPNGMVIPVDLWRGDLGASPVPEKPICEGTMMDLSAGGISVSLPSDRAPGWDQDETVSCSFLLEPMEPPVRVSGQVRHRDKMPDGHVRVGVRFMGLDTSPDQRETLRRITQLAARFRRS